MKLVSAKCPSCGASLKLSKEDETVKCEYCKQTVIVDDAIACYKLKVSGKVDVSGIETNDDTLKSANELLEMNEFLKAKKKFMEFSEKCPDNYRGWLGLLLCRTRNFTIRDNNIMFENDIKKYYEHFLKTADDAALEKYGDQIENYMFPKKVEVEPKIKKIEMGKYKDYIAPIIVFLISFSAFTDNVISGILVLCAGIVLIPQIYSKIKLTQKSAIIIAVVLVIIGIAIS